MLTQACAETRAKQRIDAAALSLAGRDLAALSRAAAAAEAAWQAIPGGWETFVERSAARLAYEAADAAWYEAEELAKDATMSLPEMVAWLHDRDVRAGITHEMTPEELRAHIAHGYRYGPHEDRNN